MAGVHPPLTGGSSHLPPPARSTPASTVPCRKPPSRTANRFTLSLRRWPAAFLQHRLAMRARQRACSRLLLRRAYCSSRSYPLRLSAARGRVLPPYQRRRVLLGPILRFSFWHYLHFLACADSCAAAAASHWRGGAAVTGWVIGGRQWEGAAEAPQRQPPQPHCRSRQRRRVRRRRRR